MSNVVFRADASPAIGGGHIMRCLALADRLRQRGETIWFACRAQTFDTIPKLLNSGHNIIELPAHGDEQQRFVSALPKTEWLVVDHYALDATWMSAQRGWAQRILAIDDLANRPLDCDLLLDQTLARSDDDYRTHTPKQCSFLLGPEFALLRSEFAAARAECLAHRKDQKNGPLKVLVTMGATDPDNATELALEALDQISTSIEIVAVLGSAAPHLDSVGQRALKLRHPTQVLTDVTNMAALMCDADIAVGANGTSSWERCCLGLPTIAIELADNQHDIGVALSKAGAIHFLGRQQDINIDRLVQEFTQLISNPEQMTHMAQMAARVCDGQGATRVADRMLS